MVHSIKKKNEKRDLISYLLNIFLSNKPSDSATIHATAASPVTFTEVLNISRILSTARIMPMASSGKPNCWRIKTKVIVPAEGTAAAPMDATTAKIITWTYWIKVKSIHPFFRYYWRDMERTLPLSRHFAYPWIRRPSRCIRRFYHRSDFGHT